MAESVFPANSQAAASSGNPQGWHSPFAQPSGACLAAERSVQRGVVRGDSILWEEGFGWADPEKHTPVTVNTPFYLASVTKTITATALMVLREQGRIDLDRPVNDYLGAAKLGANGPETRVQCHWRGRGPVRRFTRCSAYR